MNTRAALTLGLSAFALCGTIAGATHGGTAFASARNESRDERFALDNARKAQALLAAGRPEAAIAAAEASVGARPNIADYRMTLGQAYLKSGRFTSARDAFGDALALGPGNGKAALNLSLALIATGDWDAARKMLDAHADTIAPSDRGLAIALAGDPAGAVEVLTQAVRTPGSDAKARQNLGLALALAGRWPEAKTMVAYDVAPEEVDARIAQWATFAKPHAAFDQVATLLGVRAVEDQGQPVALALNAPVAPAKTDPVDAYMPGQASAPAQAVVASTVAAAAPTPAAVVAPVSPTASTGVQFGPRHEIVQAVPTAVAYVAPTRVPMAAPASAASPLAKPAAKGDFYVQVGAYENSAVAKDAWHRMARRFVGHTPSGMNFAAKGTNFYRLSIGGFTRGDAAAMCRSYRATGGHCFVRAGAGDQMAAWTMSGKKLASR